MRPVKMSWICCFYFDLLRLSAHLSQPLWCNYPERASLSLNTCDIQFPPAEGELLLWGVGEGEGDGQWEGQGNTGRNFSESCTGLTCWAWLHWGIPPDVGWHCRWKSFDGKLENQLITLIVEILNCGLVISKLICDVNVGRSNVILKV